MFCYANPRPKLGRPGIRFARDTRWKLYGDGRLYDVGRDPLEERPVSAGQGLPDAALARKRLQAALDAMPKEPQRLLEKE